MKLEAVKSEPLDHLGELITHNQSKTIKTEWNGKTQIKKEKKVKESIAAFEYFEPSIKQEIDLSSNPLLNLQNNNAKPEIANVEEYKNEGGRKMTEKLIELRQRWATVKPRKKSNKTLSRLEKFDEKWLKSIRKKSDKLRIRGNVIAKKIEKKSL